METVYTNHMEVVEAEVPKGWLLIERVGLVDPDMLEFVADSGQPVPTALGVWLNGTYLFPTGTEIRDFALVLVCDPQRAAHLMDALRTSAVRNGIEPALQAEVDQTTAARKAHFNDPRR
jgi:hypothetical protein